LTSIPTLGKGLFPLFLGSRTTFCPTGFFFTLKKWEFYRGRSNPVTQPLDTLFFGIELFSFFCPLYMLSSSGRNQTSSFRPIFFKFNEEKYPPLLPHICWCFPFSSVFGFVPSFFEGRSLTTRLFDIGFWIKKVFWFWNGVLLFFLKRPPSGGTLVSFSKSIKNCSKSLFLNCPPCWKNPPSSFFPFSTSSFKICKHYLPPPTPPFGPSKS